MGNHLKLSLIYLITRTSRCRLIGRGVLLQLGDVLHLIITVEVLIFSPLSLDGNTILGVGERGIPKAGFSGET